MEEEKRADLTVNLSPEYRRHATFVGSPGSEHSNGGKKASPESPRNANGAFLNTQSPSPCVSRGSSATTSPRSSPAFHSTFFSPRDKKDVPVGDLSFYLADLSPKQTKAHAVRNSQYLFKKMIHKSVIFTFEQCAQEKGNLLSRHEFDDFLVKNEGSKETTRYGNAPLVQCIPKTKPEGTLPLCVLVAYAPRKRS